MKVERRVFDTEMRADDGGRIAGHAAVFGVWTDMGPFRERVDPGAFADAVGGQDDVRALFNHDSNFVLGRNTAGTLTLTEDERGLRYEIDPPDTQYARDLMVSIQRGDITQSSYAFTVPRDGQRWETIDGVDHRTVTRVKLFDVSPVTYPAEQSTDVSLRSAAEVWAERTQGGEQDSIEQGLGALPTRKRKLELMREG